MSNKDEEDEILNLQRSHPDSHAIDDWHLYGPRDSRIADLVDNLVIHQCMRLADVEKLIVETLERKMDEF